MADNVAITAGSGTSIATDEVAVNGGSVAHVQYVKLVDGTANGAGGVPGDGTNGLFVNARRVIPGTTATDLGKAEDAAHTDGDTGVMLLGVRNYTGAGTDGDYSAVSVDSSGNLAVVARRDLQRIAVQTSSGLTIATTAYTGGDQVGTQFTLANAARVSGGTGVITGVVLTSALDSIGAYDVVFTRSSITLAADNAAYAISDTDANAVVGVVQLAGAFDIGNNRIAQAFNLAVPYDCSGGTSLYAGLITRVGHTFFAAQTDLQLQVFVERN